MVSSSPTAPGGSALSSIGGTGGLLGRRWTGCAAHRGRVGRTTRAATYRRRHSCVVVTSGMVPAPGAGVHRAATVSRVQLTVVDHPLARARLTRMRDERTDNAAFRAALAELTQMLVYEATRDLPVAEEPITTPVTDTTGYRLAAPPLIVPVLRAGLGMADTAHAMLPESQMGFVGLARNEVTFQPEAYMASLPSSLVDREVFVLDPMLATGGGLVHCCGRVCGRGAPPITLLCAAAALTGHPSAELVGVWGRDLSKAEAIGADFDVPGFSDLAALLDQVDAVAIAVPPSVQVGLAEQAAAAGKHLLLEKPIGLSLEEADRVVAAVRSAGVASVVFFTFRFQAGTSTWMAQAARTRLAGGAGSWLSALAGSPFDSAWRREHGALWDIGPPALSLLLPTLGPV